MVMNYPVKSFVVTPTKYLEILKGKKIEEIRRMDDINNKAEESKNFPSLQIPSYVLY